MGRQRSKATSAEILAAFHTDEPFKAAAKRLGMSPNTLRPLWKDAFGEDAFKARGKTLQARAAAATCRATAATRTYKDVRVPCTGCGNEVLMKANQAAQIRRDTFICEDCQYDRTCPVCGLLVNGERGLAGHFRHRRDAGDTAHREYQEVQVDARWVGKVEGRDYVVCLVCGHKAETLARHLKAAHSITADQYRVLHGEVRIRSERVEQARRESLRASRGSEVYQGTKEVLCPSCGASCERSKFLVPGVHDLRCSACRELEDAAAEAARWVGKSEPADFVECRVCKWRGENLTGHLGSEAHPSMTLAEYHRKYPAAPIFISSAYQFQPSANKLNLTAQDLAPFKDKKGRVQVALAADVLDCSGLTVRNYCKELGIPTRNRLAFQKRVLDALADVVGEAYEWEWSDLRVTNPETGYRFYFDGFFPGKNLLVEVHGKQHFVFIPYWHKERSVFKAMQARDVVKRGLVLGLGYRLLTIRYDEPYTDVSYLRGRLKEVLHRAVGGSLPTPS